MAVPTAACLGLLLTGSCANKDQPIRAPVGQVGPNTFWTPANQRLTPAGIQVELPRMRPQVLALSPDGRRLLASGKTHELLVVDPANGAILQRVALPSNSQVPGQSESSTRLLVPDKDAQVSYSGLVCSRDGSRIYLSSVNGSIKVFRVQPADALGDHLDDGVVGIGSFELPEADARGRKAEIPSGLALSADGSKLYACGNLSNSLFELDSTTGQVLRSWDVGVAPFDVVVAGNRAFVSNWGGRRPAADSLVGPAGRGTSVRVDAQRRIACEGSLSVIDLDGAGPPRDIVTGLHASAMALSPDGKSLVVANTASDSLSVIDLASERVTKSICMRQTPADLFGAQPAALAFAADGNSLFVCNASQNAVAVVDFDDEFPHLRGLIPVGWFPGAIAIDSSTIPPTICVANIKGIGSTKRFGPGEQVKLQTHQHFGTLSLVPMPRDELLPKLSQQALDNMRHGLLEESRLPARPGMSARAVPERPGEPSLIKHVIYIIRENRTYDQVFGDIPEGNGDPTLCTFGEEVTPNLHALAREFVLLDNTYCSGVLSADGHQWTDSGITTDYVERSFAGFPRSYPDGMDMDDADALAYAPSGFIWDNAIEHGRTLRIYGEFAQTTKNWADGTERRRITWTDCWEEFNSGAGKLTVGSVATIDSIKPWLCARAPGWDLDIPDLWRARVFIDELAEFEKHGQMPQLIVICLPNDHTAGTKEGMPTPAAQVADNDLAMGRIVEAVTHSSFWKDTCIFSIEDDPQAGWDHVSGYRTTALVISPFTKRHEVVSTQYNHTSILRTLELMLGMPPMNQFDATATPMSDCFVADGSIDLTPFVARPSRIALNTMNPRASAISDPLLRNDAVESASLPLDELDQCPEDLFNRILWRAMKGPTEPYPEWAVGHHDDD